MFFAKRGDKVIGHVHKEDHASLAICGGVRINPCEDAGDKDENGNIIWSPLPEMGVDYICHDAEMMNHIRFLLASTERRHIDATIEKIREEYNTPRSSSAIPAANIPDGMAHEIIALYDRTLFICVFSLYRQ
jgi:hypothetical protein